MNLWFWCKNSNFSNFFSFGNKGQGNVFNDILERKNAFLNFGNNKFKKSKNCHFSNFFFLGNICQGNVFDDILERKMAFVSYKNKKSKSRKNQRG